MQRCTSQLIFRANTESNTLTQFYLENFCCLLLDHLIQDAGNSFTKYFSTVYLCMGLLLLFSLKKDNSKGYD